MQEKVTSDFEVKILYWDIVFADFIYWYVCFII